MGHFLSSDRCGMSRWYPTVPAAEDAEEPWFALIDDLPADFGRVALGSHAPSQINVDQMDALALELFPESRKNETHQVIALGLHVKEGRTNEYSDGSPNHGFALYVWSLSGCSDTLGDREL